MSEEKEVLGEKISSEEKEVLGEKISSEEKSIINIKEKKGKTVSGWFIISSLLFLSSIFLVIIFLKQFSKDYLLIGGSCVISVILLFLLLDELSNIIEKVRNAKIEMYEKHMKAMKALYVSNKNSLDEVSEKIQILDENCYKNINDLFIGQKTIAKTIIKKNIEGLRDVRSAVNNIKLDEIKLDNSKIDDNKQDNVVEVKINNEEILESINNLNKECKEISNICGNILGHLSEININSPIQEFDLNSQRVFKEAEENQIVDEIPKPEENEIADEMLKPEQTEIAESQEIDFMKNLGIDFSDNLELREEDFGLLGDELIDKESLIEGLKDSNITDAIEEMKLQEENIVEEQVVEEQVAEEKVVEEPIAEEPVVEEKVVEEPIVEEQVVEEPNISGSTVENSTKNNVGTIEPDLDNSNKQMSADEIAALFAALQ